MQPLPSSYWHEAIILVPFHGDIRGGYYDIILSDLTSCDRLNVAISGKIINEDAFTDVAARGASLDIRVKAFQCKFDALGRWEDFVEPFSTVSIPDELTYIAEGLEREIGDLRLAMTAQKLKISAFIRTPLYRQTLKVTDCRARNDPSVIRMLQIPTFQEIDTTTNGLVDKAVLADVLKTFSRLDDMCSKWFYTQDHLMAAGYVQQYGWNMHVPGPKNIDDYIFAKKVLEKPTRGESGYLGDLLLE